MTNTGWESTVHESTRISPLWNDVEFDTLIKELVADFAPRLFAVVQEYGNRDDGRIAAWGMAFSDHADIITVGEYETRLHVCHQERIIAWFSQHPHITARIVWV